jgi:outer membrane protein OmpA-like peptidoglycan-associated protein
VDDNEAIVTLKGKLMASIQIHSRRLLLAACSAAVLATGCADMNMSPSQRDTAVGAGLGALAGAIVGGDTRGAVIGGALGAGGGYVWSRHMQEKKSAMERATRGTGVGVTQTSDNRLKLNIPSDVSFDVGRAEIKPSLRPILDQFANGLAGQPNTEVHIVGHTDSTGSEAINNPLSLDRAQSTRNYLTGRGVDPRRIQIEGRGEREPIADNSTEAGRARNRRVEIYLGERADVARY